MSTTPLWLHDAPLPFPRRWATWKCNVVVIGAGLCGTSATLSLAEAGVDVIQLEAGTAASGATGRNAGFILQGTAERYDRAVGVMGRARARRVHEWSLENHRRLRHAIERHQIECDYRQNGSIQLASSPSEARALEASAALLVADGFSAQLLAANQLPESLQAAGYKRALVLPEDGELHPARLAQHAGQAAIQLGARRFDQSPVLALDAERPGHATVRTPQATVSADLVLVCTNARIGTLLPWYQSRVDPVRGQMLSTAPAPPLFPQPIYADHGYDYWRQTTTGHIILGGWRNLDPQSEVGHEDRLHDAIQARMTAFLRAFPALASVPIEHRWSGTMGFSRDGLPIIGPAPGTPAALAAAGFTGHGFGFAWLAGEALAALAIDGQHPIVEDLGPSRLR